MKNKSEVSDVIRGMCSKTLDIDNLENGDDFFNHGATSLSIVELQVKIEQELEVKVPTSELMLHSSIDGWVKAYESAMLESS